MSLDYEIIRSDRKTIAIQIKPDGQVLIRCPRRMRREDILAFVRSKEAWIQKHLAKLANSGTERLSEQTLESYREITRKKVTARVAHYAGLMGVSYGRIAIRAQHTRWGSCSGKGNLNFNCLLARVPDEVLDYVVVHELCHRKEMNHSARFWAEVAAVLPDYQQRRKWLKENGGKLIAGL